MAASASAYEEEMEEEEEEVQLNNFFWPFLALPIMLSLIKLIDPLIDGTWRKGGIQWEQEL